MEIKDIKPIPQYILKLIKNYDDKTIKIKPGITRFYNYFTTIKKEIALVTVAVRNYRNKWFCKQVVVHGINSDKCFLKDIVFFNTCGYKVGWFAEGCTQYERWYENNDWDWNDDKYFNIGCPVINYDYILKKEQFKYCAINIARPYQTMKYLRLYQQYPEIEMLAKFGLRELTTSKTILNLLHKDKSFRKWLIKNRDNIINKWLYKSTIIKAYKNNKDLTEIQKKEEMKKCFYRQDGFRQISHIMQKNQYEKFMYYIKNNNINLSSYCDYVTACEYLNLDLSIEKNRQPKDFKRWHDIRIDQYHTKQALDKKQEKAKLYSSFKNIAFKYVSLEREKEEDFIVIIAKSPKDLIREGNILDHCVGSMNYEQKFIKEESLIFFVRNKNNATKPFVTLEYSLSKHKVLQCYGYKDSRPEQQVLDFVNKKWLPYANRKLKKLVA